MTVQILVGDCRELMSSLPAESVDAIVTDPPYDLTSGKKGGSGVASVNLASPYGRARIGTGNGGGFMGKTWDSTGVAFDPATWAEALRVLKPGSHLVAFGGTRTFHRMTCAIEDAGFEIRDCLSWLYGSGFPKSHNLPGGLGTALKPAWEPIILARKPLIGTVAANVERHGTGAINVDGCRIESGEAWPADGAPSASANGYGPGDADGWHGNWSKRGGSHALGRWPANVCLDEGAAAMLDAQSGQRTSGRLAPHHKRYSARLGQNTYGDDSGGDLATNGASYGGDTGGASRFFYCAKASRSERNAGLEGAEERSLLWSAGTQNPGSFQSENTHRAARNHHPTVKPVSLMQWLVRLVTPPCGVVLDPFMGSGTTGIACSREGRDFIGIEQNAEYADIARRRIAGDAPLFAAVACVAPHPTPAGGA